MKKLWKKLLAVTTAVMMAITLLPAMANANATDGKGSVTIIKNGEESDEFLAGAKFSFYKIASITNSEGKDWKYTVEEDITIDMERAYIEAVKRETDISHKRLEK